MKFFDYTEDASAGLLSYRRRFAELAGKLNHDRIFHLVGYLASNIFALSQESKAKPIFVSISGAQGTGKSTITRLLSSLLSDCFNLSVSTLSLDDFYLPQQERRNLAREVHPLLEVRGVPGTHDLALMREVIANLHKGKAVQVPIFDKGEDDRGYRSQEVGPATVILCEGWCWGAIPEPEQRLLTPLNELERIQDTNGLWRRYVNEQLAAYQSVFHSDAQIFFMAPSVEAIVRWRFQQEVELLKRSGGSKIMTEIEVRSFVTYYERVTLWMLEEMPFRASVAVSLDENHSVREVVAN